MKDQRKTKKQRIDELKGLRQQIDRLEENEIKFRALAETTASAIFIYSGERILYGNPSAAEIFGYTQGELLTEMNFWEVAHPDFKESIKTRELARQRGESVPVRYELKIVTKNGKEKWLDISDGKIEFEGKPAILGTAFDITERKLAYEALSREKLFSDAIIDSAPGIYYVIDEKGHFIRWNKNEKRVTGYSADEMSTINPLDTIAEEDRALVASKMQEVFTKGSSFEEALVLTKQGRKIPYLLTGVLLVIGDKKYLVGMGVDITERKRAEGALRESEMKYRLLVENQTDLVVEVDLDGRFLFVSPSYCNTFGKKENELLGQKFMPLVHEDDREATVKAMEALFKPPYSAYMEQRALTKDGWRWLAWADTAVLDEKGNVVSIIGVGRDINERKQADEKLQRQLNRLAALRSIDMAITASVDLRVTLSVLLDNVATQLNVDAVSLLIERPHLNVLEYVAGRGFKTKAIKHSYVRMGHGYAGHVARTRKIFTVPDISCEMEGSRRPPFFDDEGFKAYFGVPLIAKGRVIGVMEIFNRSSFKPDEEWMDFLESLAGQAAIAIDNANMFDNLQRYTDDLIMAYESTIEGWSRALDYRDKETEGHSERVMQVTLEVARALKLDEEEIVHIRRGALLHDIGKLGIPDNILHKPGKLSEDEWVLMKKHPQIAHDLLYPIEFLRPAIDIPYCHHEKWDGSGYPRGLKGEEIPFAARIFAVVDVYDALNSDRPYCPAWPKEKIEEEIRHLSGTHFEPKIVDIFLKIK